MSQLDSLLQDRGLTCAALNDDHDVVDFECKHDTDMPDWLARRAHAYHREGLCRVWVLSPVSDQSKVAGFYTLCAHSITTQDVARSQRVVDRANGSLVGSLANLPAQLLGKFALDAHHQGQGLGVLLMACAYRSYLTACEHAASKFMVLHAREAKVIEYYGNLGFQKSHLATGSLTTMYRATSGITQDLAGLS